MRNSVQPKRKKQGVFLSLKTDRLKKEILRFLIFWAV